MELGVEPFWGEESREAKAKFSSPGAHLYPYFNVPGGVRVRAGQGTLLGVLCGTARVLLDNEREMLPDATPNRPKPRTRGFAIEDVYPAHVSTEAINESRKARARERQKGRLKLV